MSNAGGHWQSSQRRIPRRETHTGSDSATVLLRYSSLMWNDHSSRLAAHLAESARTHLAIDIFEIAEISFYEMTIG